MCDAGEEAAPEQTGHRSSAVGLPVATLVPGASLSLQGSASSLLPAFDQLATLLRELGSPARQAPAMAAHGRTKAELGGCSGDVAGISRALVKALRLMSAQLRLLQIDMGNATLRLLAGSLAGGEGIRCASQVRDRDSGCRRLLGPMFNGKIRSRKKPMHQLRTRCHLKQAWLQLCVSDAGFELGVLIQIELMCLRFFWQVADFWRGLRAALVHCSYARQKFAEKHEVRPEMPLAALAPMLPHTRAWLAQASGQLLSLHATLPASSSSNVSHSASTTLGCS